MSFFSTVVPVIMRQENYSLEAIGLIQFVKIPWILKFLWAPIIDKKAKTTKKLRQIIISSEIFYAFVIVIVGFFSLKTDFMLIIIFVSVAFVISATQDIATDIYAIINLKTQERAFGNSMQAAGSFVGSLLGTGVMLIAYYYFGWIVLMFIISFFVCLAIIPLVFFKKDAKILRDTAERIHFKNIITFFTQKKVALHIVILIFYYSGIIGILSMLKPYLVDLGYNIKQIGVISGIFGTSMAVIASIAGGIIVKKLKIKLSLIIFALLNAITAVFFWRISLTTPNLIQIYIAVGLLWFGYGLSTVVIYTKSMGIVRKNNEGTDFTIQIVISHLSAMTIAVVSGKVADKITYSGLFKYETILAIAVLVFIIVGVRKNDK